MPRTSIVFFVPPYREHKLKSNPAMSVGIIFTPPTCETHVPFSSSRNLRYVNYKGAKC